MGSLPDVGSFDNLGALEVHDSLMCSGVLRETGSFDNYGTLEIHDSFGDAGALDMVDSFGLVGQLVDDGSLPSIGSLRMHGSLSSDGTLTSVVHSGHTVLSNGLIRCSVRCSQCFDSLIVLGSLASLVQSVLTELFGFVLHYYSTVLCECLVHLGGPVLSVRAIH